MSKLQTCYKCKRHVRVEEPSCPFCGEASITVSRGPVRAALFAGALAGATALGCGDAKPAVEDPSHKVGPSPTDSDAMAAGPVEGDREFARDPDETDEEERKEAERQDNEEQLREAERRDRLPNMPYGAPPARRRLV